MTLANKEEILANYEKFCGKCGRKSCYSKELVIIGRDPRALWLSNDGQIFCKKYKSKSKIKPESGGLFEIMK